MKQANRDSAFATWLRATLDQREMTGGRLAAALGIGPPTAYKWINGENVPSSGQVPGIARVLGVDEETVRAQLS